MSPPANKSKTPNPKQIRNAKFQIRNVYKVLYKKFGPQHWWPGETRFEVIVGAILTQNTNWKNVERAIQNLKLALKSFTPQTLHALNHSQLALLIKPAGYFNVKAKRLKNFLDFLFEEYGGSINRMQKEEMPLLRKKLLSVNGIGPETADSILLYAVDKPSFVIDAYTKRLLLRHGIINQKVTYHEMQDLFMRALKSDAPLFNEYHALIVKLGKDFCRVKPKCETCPLFLAGYKPVDSL